MTGAPRADPGMESQPGVVQPLPLPALGALPHGEEQVWL